MLKMRNIVLYFLIINILRVNCGLLKGVLTPVTEKVQNNELLDEHARKENEAEKKGLVSNLVEGLDTGLGKVVDPVTNLLNQGNKNKDNADKKEESPKNDSKVDVSEKAGVKDNIPKDVSNNTRDTNLNDTNEGNKEIDSAKDNLNTTTPKTDIKTDITTEISKTENCTKENDCTEKPKLETEDGQVGVTRRVNFDGSQCPTGTERAHDDTCKEVQ